jgi:hypothetical protein
MLMPQPGRRFAGIVSYTRESNGRLSTLFVGVEVWIAEGVGDIALWLQEMQRPLLTIQIVGHCRLNRRLYCWIGPIRA